MPPLEDVSAYPFPGPPSSEGDAFLILDLPKHSTVGCDARAIGTGASEFKGIRGIPPGAHFVWVSEPNAMSRSGYWFVTGADGGRVRIKQWDKYNEVLIQPASQFEMRDLSENIASLLPQLVPYGYGSNEEEESPSASAVRPTSKTRQAGTGNGDGAEMWRRLTSSIGEGLLSRVTGKRDVGEFLVDTSDTAKGESGVFFPQTTTRTYKTVAGTGELDFLFPEGDVDLLGGVGGSGSGEPDTTASILRLLDTPGTGVTGPDLLGELQFTFLTGLHLSNLSCVDQWWHLVLRVILRAHDLTLRRPALARDLIRTLHAQVVYNEEYIAGGGAGARKEDDDEEEEVGVPRPRHEYGGADAHGTSILDIAPGNKRKLRGALTLFKRRLDEILLNLPGAQITAEQAAVGQAFADMEAWFWKFGWDLRVDAASARRKAAAAGRDEEGYDDDDDDGELGRDGDDDDDDDYQPVIVDLDEDGREVGLVSFNS